MRQRALNGHVKGCFPHPRRITIVPHDRDSPSPRRVTLRVDGVGGIAHPSWNKDTNKQN